MTANNFIEELWRLEELHTAVVQRRRDMDQCEEPSIGSHDAPKLLRWKENECTEDTELLQRGQAEFSHYVVRLREGEEQAWNLFMLHEMPWLRYEVRQELRRGPQRQLEVPDLVQGTLLDFLHFGPRFLPKDNEEFRHLLKRLVVNRIHDERRRASRIRFSSLHSAQLKKYWQDEDPLDVAEMSEDAAWVRLALEFLPGPERELVILRDYERLEWSRIAKQLEMPSAKSAKIAMTRVRSRVSIILRRLYSGQIPE